jgi:hypothetical protein
MYLVALLDDAVFIFVFGTHSGFHAPM